MVAYDPLTDNDPNPWSKMAEDRHRCPIAHIKQQGVEYFQVSTYELVKQAHRDYDNFRNAPGVSLLGAMPAERQVLTFADPPRHTFQRKLLGKAFSASRVNLQAARIQEIADDLVDAIAAQESRSFPLRAAFARPLPAQTFLEILGIPVDDRDRLLGWIDVEERSVGKVLSSDEQAQLEAEFHQMEDEFHAYARAEMRKRFGTQARDLLSAIINAEVDGQRASETEAAAIIHLLLTAGVGTSSVGISNLIWAIESHPEEKRKLLSDLDGLAESAVEEGFRFDCPVQGNFRGVGKPSQLGGLDLQAGDRLYMLMSSANHDELVYDRPDEFIVDRDWANLPRHMAFGFGIHFCIGSDLARLVTQIALKTIYRRLPGLRAEPGYEPTQIPGMTFRTWREVEMVYDGPALPRAAVA